MGGMRAQGVAAWLFCWSAADDCCSWLEVDRMNVRHAGAVVEHTHLVQCLEGKSGLGTRQSVPNRGVFFSLLRDITAIS
jgi:hypothetical protein